MKVHYRVTDDGPNLCGEADDDCFTRTGGVATCVACRCAIAARRNALAFLDAQPPAAAAAADDAELAPGPENINHPAHYNQHPSGVEAIVICETMGFNLGNAIKYLMRADYKGQKLDDLKKAAWYVAREIERVQKEEK